MGFNVVLEYVKSSMDILLTMQNDNSAPEVYNFINSSRGGHGNDAMMRQDSD